MRLKKRRLFLSLVMLIIFVTGVIMISKARSGYFNTRCIDYKQKEYSRRLTDKIVDYINSAKARGIKPCRDENDLHQRISDGRLVKVSSNSLYIVERMTFSDPYLTPAGKSLLDEITKRLQDKASQKGLNNVKVYITSMTRKPDDLKDLRRSNWNASANSPHLYGNAFDISYKRFAAKKWILTNCDKRYLKESLAEIIWQLKNENRCWATYEKLQNCFHVVAR